MFVAVRRLHFITWAVLLVVVLALYGGLVTASASAHTVEGGLVAPESNSGGDIQPHHIITGNCGSVDFTVFRSGRTAAARIGMFGYPGVTVTGRWTVDWGDGTTSSGWIPTGVSSWSYRITIKSYCPAFSIMLQ